MKRQRNCGHPDDFAFAPASAHDAHRAEGAVLHADVAPGHEQVGDVSRVEAAGEGDRRGALCRVRVDRVRVLALADVPEVARTHVIGRLHVEIGSRQRADAGVPRAVRESAPADADFPAGPDFLGDDCGEDEIAHGMGARNYRIVPINAWQKFSEAGPSARGWGFRD